MLSFSFRTIASHLPKTTLASIVVGPDVADGGRVARGVAPADDLEPGTGLIFMAPLSRRSIRSATSLWSPSSSRISDVASTSTTLRIYGTPRKGTSHGESQEG